MHILVDWPKLVDSSSPSGRFRDTVITDGWDGYLYDREQVTVTCAQGLGFRVF